MRYVSPSFLVFALVMSLLPWVEVRCESVDAGPFGRYAVVTQNGWQALLGEATGRVPTAQQLGAPDNRAQKELPKKIERDLEPAPLVGVFLGCALAAAILGFTVPGRKTRLIVTAVLCLGAFGALAAQTAVGFPLKKKDQAAILNYLQEVAPDRPDLRGPKFLFSTAYTVWLYFALAATGGAAVALLGEALNPPRRRRRREDEEEDEEDFDDRPRRRRRRPRYEDEEEEYEEEDDPGPRRPPRDRKRPRDDFYR